MKYDTVNRTFDCEPTLTDTEVLQYCRDGYLQLQGAVPDEINQRTCDYLNGDLPINPCFLPEGITHADLERMRDTHEPSSILLEDWYIEHVLLNRELAGALRSLLGENVGLPVLVSNHRVECPMPAQGWHHDADHVFGGPKPISSRFFTSHKIHRWNWVQRKSCRVRIFVLQVEI